MHDATRELGNWVSQCLDSKDVLNWVIRQGGVIHQYLRRAIRFKLEHENNDNKIAPGLVTIWQVLANEYYAHVLSSKQHYEYNFFPPLSPNNKSTQRDFINRLRPIPIFSISPDYLTEHGKSDTENPSSFCNIEIQLTGIEDSHHCQHIRESATDWDATLAILAEDITTLLSEAMEWQATFNLVTQVSEFK